MTNDAELLREYVESQSDAAFAELVGRHVNLVYSTAFRMVRENALAQDVVQSVFVQLAAKRPRSARATRCRAGFTRLLIVRRPMPCAPNTPAADTKRRP